MMAGIENPPFVYTPEDKLSEEQLAWATEGCQANGGGCELHNAYIDSGGSSGNWGALRIKGQLYVSDAIKKLWVGWRVIGLDSIANQSIRLFFSGVEDFPVDNSELIGFRIGNAALYGRTADGTNSHEVALGVSVGSGWQDTRLVAVWDLDAAIVSFHVNGVKKGESALNLPPTGRRYWHSAKIETLEDSNKRIYCGNCIRTVLWR